MYIVTNKQTGFKHYFNKDQFNTFYQSTGKKLILLNKKKFTDTYSFKQIKEYDMTKIFSKLFSSENLYFLLCLGLSVLLTAAFIYFGGK